MIKGVKDILKDFRHRSGLHILVATFIARIMSFFASWIALQLIEDTKLGLVIYAFTIISFIIPVSGLGLHQSLIRYSALLKEESHKNSLFIYVLKKGMFWSFFIVVLVIASSYIFSSFLIDSQLFVIILSIAIPTSFLLEIIKVQFRLNHQNRQFAMVEITYNIILVMMVFILSFTFKEVGYSVALVATPLMCSIIFFNKLNINFSKHQKLSITDLSFWKYGFFSSLSNVATQFLSAIDILLIGYLLNQSELVTIYKYVALVPLALLFLPRVFLTTDFVNLTEKIFEKNYIKNYIKNYMILFTSISIIIGFFSFLFANQILLFFGPNFTLYSNSFLVLIVGVVGILIFRGLFGNLLSSIGKAHVNYWIALTAILINLILNYYFIPIYGVFGAAMTSAILMWFTGIISMLMFFKYYSKLPTK
jgi:O-antigen/teichoic acid export membrane protein